MADSFRMADEEADRTTIVAVESTSIPYLDQTVITTAKYDVGVLSVREAHRINLVSMRIVHRGRQPIRHEVIDEELG